MRHSLDDDKFAEVLSGRFRHLLKKRKKKGKIGPTQSKGVRTREREREASDLTLTAAAVGGAAVRLVGHAA